MTIYPPLFSGNTPMQIAMQGARMVSMNADQYLFDILRREAVDTSATSPALNVLNILRQPLINWAGGRLFALFPSGSFAKGTANRSGTDIDIFISLSHETTETLRDIYSKLHDRMTELGYSPTKQNVSINIKVGSYDVDLVPGKRHDAFSSDHSLYRRKADTWQQTNVLKHIQVVRESHRLNECRILKLWRKQKRLEFPSFYVELTVIEALRGSGATLSENVRKSLEYMRDRFTSARVVDPANTNNIISDDLTIAEKTAVKNAAERALAGSWTELVK
jgi:predicted nucleotidyltransferase